MADFAFGFNADILNTLSQRLYQALYPDYFKYEHDFTKDGKSYKLSWDAKSAPVFDLKTKVDVRALAEAAIPDGPLPFGLTRARFLDDIVIGYVSRTFLVVLDDVALTLEIDGTPVHDTARITIPSVVQVKDDRVSFMPLSGKVTTGKKFDDWVYEKNVVPMALTTARAVLQNFKFPPLHYAGISLTPPAPVVANDQVVLLANLEGRPRPAAEVPADWPNDPCVLRVGPDGVRAATGLAARIIDGKEFPRKGSKGWGGVAEAYYDITIRAGKARVGDRITTDRTVDVTVAVDGRGSAGINHAVGSVDGHIKVRLSPDPTLTLQLELNDTTLHARTKSVSDFGVHVAPDGGDVSSELVAWISDELSGYFKSAVRDGLSGFAADVFTVPSVPFSLGKAHLEAKPSGLQFTVAGDGTVTVRGQLTIS